MVSTWCVAGIGSPHGDDRVGWRVVDELQRILGLSAGLYCLVEPSRLLDVLPTCEQLVLVDGVQGVGSGGTIVRMEWPFGMGERTRFGSSHALCLPDVLLLAQQLGSLPRRVILYGIEVQACEPGTDLSPLVEAAARDVVARVALEIQDLP